MEPCGHYCLFEYLVLLLVERQEKALEPIKHSNLGRLLRPKDFSRAEDTSQRRPWAADNGSFGELGFNEKRFIDLLERVSGLPRCCFIAAPDVVADMESTMKQWPYWRDTIRSYDLPVALVLQDGHLVSNVPFDDLDAVFIGGTTEWKLGSEARAIVEEANRQSKWTHMGRVNSFKRMSYARSISCDSIDGSRYAMFQNNYLLDALSVCSDLKTQGVLF